MTEFYKNNDLNDYLNYIKSSNLEHVCAKKFYAVCDHIFEFIVKFHLLNYL